jgi:hypothetical protein
MQKQLVVYRHVAMRKQKLRWYVVLDLHPWQLPKNELTVVVTVTGGNASIMAAVVQKVCV